MQTQLLLNILTVCLAVGVAGCAVLPVALDRSFIPSSRVALAEIAATQRQLDTAWAAYDKSFEAGAAEPVSAHGSLYGAYQRLVNDQVRELPEAEAIVIGESGGGG